ncbi:hypothetical protein COCOBI_12-3810 [Coccomyxa sp. Obi]|nr:hypothetical protein COCOBI_12-3810 [Coccomyxa sp. Obi]
MCWGELERVAKFTLSLGQCSTDSELYRIAACTCRDLVPETCHISFSLLSENETQLHYFEVHTAEGRSHGHLGTFPVENTGSGVAVALKRPVLTSKDGKRGLRRLDWQHLQHICGAGSCIHLPLKVSDKVLGTLNIASLRPNAFDGRIKELAAFAAVLAPVIGLQRFRRDLVAVDSLLRRIFPAHIVDSLHELRTPVVSLGMPVEVADALAARIASDKAGCEQSSCLVMSSHGKATLISPTLNIACTGPSKLSSPSLTVNASPVAEPLVNVSPAAKPLVPGLDTPSVPRLCMDLATLLLTVTSVVVPMSRLGASEQATAVAFLVAMGVLVSLMTGAVTYTRHRSTLLAGVRMLRTVVFAINRACAAPAALLSCAGLCMDSGAFLLATLTFSSKVPTRVHIPVQCACVAVLAAANAVGCALGRMSVHLALAELAAQVLLGALLPSLILLHIEQAAALTHLQKVAGKKAK